MVVMVALSSAVGVAVEPSLPVVVAMSCQPVVIRSLLRLRWLG